MNAPDVFISIATLVLWTSLILLLALRSAACISSGAAIRHFVLIGALACVILLPLFIVASPFHATLPLPMSRPSSVALSRNLQEARLLSRDFRWLIEVFLVVWSLGSLLLAWQTAFAISVARKAVRRCSESHNFASVDLVALAKKAGLNRSFELRVRRTRSFRSPLTWGIFHPVILLPRAAIHWNSERLEVVLLHEMAHIRRYDGLSLLLARAACALYWFNPIVWRAARELNAAAEIAADDTVVKAGVRASSYAAELMSIVAEMSGHPARSWKPAMAMAVESGIEARICAIVDPANRRRGPTRLVAACLVFAALSGVIALASLRPVFANTSRLHFPADNHDPRFNPDAREYIYRTPVDPRDNPDSREYAGRRGE
jgi:beta-lactamase regulating signal transducer with metallopeptidase domain